MSSAQHDKTLQNSKSFLGISLLHNKTETLATSTEVNVAPLTPHNPHLTYRAVHNKLWTQTK